ncbi:type II secretion system F family protein [Desulfocurvibacter africanus]|uniref:Type II secretion system F domain-containing protein n=2 Tax=Desulfocurvibacter africanus TaxID=873 RepID=F3YVG8_DESAF|nr:type II secretion system F family protein [Desulfocurvibacter africanus]EGJ48560.1 Type II secretion system F domain-containing protein [Desulfocurvibacter africanus subsp. africanus str. Walvis Bay]
MREGMHVAMDDATQAATQLEYAYRAVAGDGRVATGTMTGANERQVALALQQKGLVPLEITPPAGVEQARPRRGRRKVVAIPGMPRAIRAGRTPRVGRVRNKALIAFAENLAMLLSAGIALDKSLFIITELTEGRVFRKVVADVHERIREGSSLGDALAQHPGAFPPVFVSMVTAGEKGGILEAVLDKLTDYLKNVQEIREYLVSSMIYPAILSLTSAVSVFVLLTVVLPRFATIFDDLGAAIPLPTQIMLATGAFLRGWWWAMLLAALLAVLGFRSWARTPGGRLTFDRFKLRAPLVGSIMVRIELARLSRTLGTLLSNGVSILASLNIVRGVVQNSDLKGRLGQIIEDIKQGVPLSRSLAAIEYMPSLAVHMIGVGEQTGRLDAMLHKVADVYDKELRASIKSFTSIFEPAVILVLGLVIGIMVVSIMLAIFSINEIGV